MENLPERLNWRQACEILGCSRNTFYRLIRERKLPVYGVGKRFRWVKRSECEALLQVDTTEYPLDFSLDNSTK